MLSLLIFIKAQILFVLPLTRKAQSLCLYYLKSYKDCSHLMVEGQHFVSFNAAVGVM